jgi:hypothetical protein
MLLDKKNKQLALLRWGFFVSGQIIFKKFF